MNIQKRYNINKSASVGDNCQCPSCGTTFTKGHYQQAFCKSKGGTKCKDKYWNTVTPSKKNNTTRISPTNAVYYTGISKKELKRRRKKIKLNKYIDKI